MRTNASRPDKATEKNRPRATIPGRRRARSDGGQSERRLTIETVDGDLAAIVTVTGMGHQASPQLVEEIDSAIRSELDHLVRDEPDGSGQ